MKVKELIEQLSKFPEDMEVAINVNEYQEIATGVMDYSEEDAPYAAADNVFYFNEELKGKRVVYIQ